jgi:hypothetical protein
MVKNIAVNSHRLQLTVTTPKTVTEGEAFNILYKVKNIGNVPFPAGGYVIVEISWSGVESKVYQPIIINRQLAPQEEFTEDRYSQAPLIAGYTWFHVHQAIAPNGVPVVVINSANAQIYPYLAQQVSPTTITYFRQPAHAVRARTHEELYTYWGLWAAVGSLAVVAAFQVIDWALSFYHII